MILRPGQVPVCVLGQEQICDLRLDNHFFIELRQILRYLSIESIAYDVLRGVMLRETMSRAMNEPNRFKTGRVAFLVVYMILTRDTYAVREIQNSDVRLINRKEIRDMRELLRRYGVSCVDGLCCGERKEIA